MRAAAQHDVVVIPFGGGSNIAGCLERSETRRMVVSLDMRRMRRVLAVDLESCTARIEAGVFGPDLEEQLNSSGLTLGHFPDSFLHSTLGGWIATRSAGMQSDKYGKIEDMVIALRMVTPVGVLATRSRAEVVERDRRQSSVHWQRGNSGSHYRSDHAGSSAGRVAPHSRLSVPRFRRRHPGHPRMRAERVRALDVPPQRRRQDGIVAGLQTAVVAAVAGGQPE